MANQLKNMAIKFYVQIRKKQMFNFFRNSRAMHLNPKSKKSLAYDLDVFKHPNIPDDYRHEIFYNLLNENFNKIDIAPDGNCMYNALITSYGLSHEYDHMRLRFEIKKFVENHLEFFNETNGDENVVDFLQTVMTNSVWGTPVTLLAFSLMFNCQIMIFRNDISMCPFVSIYNFEKILEIGANSKDFRMIFLKYQGNHYDCLIPQDDLSNNYDLIKDIEYAYVDAINQNVKNQSNQVIQMSSGLSKKCVFLSFSQFQMKMKFTTRKPLLNKKVTFSVDDTLDFVYAPNMITQSPEPKLCSFDEHSSYTSVDFKNDKKIEKEKRKKGKTKTRKDTRKKRKRKDTRKKRKRKRKDTRTKRKRKRKRKDTRSKRKRKN